MRLIEIVLGLLIMVYGIRFMISLCKPVKTDLNFIGFGLCFIGMIILYCLYS